MKRLLTVAAPVLGRPAKVLVYDTETGKQTGSADIVGDTDARN